jgi:hypothetical protein
MTQPVVREYKTAEEALEAANRWIADLTRRLYEAQGSLFGVKPDRGQPAPVQFAVRKRDVVREVGEYWGDKRNWPETLMPDYESHPKITTPKPVHALLDFPSVYASIQIEG